MKLMDGKKLAEAILSSLKTKVADLNVDLAIILCGKNPESVVYTNIKKKWSERIGIKATIHRFPERVAQKKLIEKIRELNQTADGILVQLPLPKKIDTYIVLNSVDPKKDVDGLHVVNLGKVLSGNEELAPATPKGIIRLLEEYNVKLAGKEVVIINSSTLIGKPLAAMLVNRKATVSVCHKTTQDIKSHTRNADILITAVGIPNFIKKEMVKKGVVIVDVGITKTGKRIFGDVDFDDVKEKASLITPVPGGVGPMTVAMVLENLVEQCKNL